MKLFFPVVFAKEHPFRGLNQLGVLVERLFLAYDLREAVPNWELSVKRFQHNCDLLTIDFKVTQTISLKTQIDCQT